MGGLKIANVKIEKGKNDVKIPVEAAANATAGDHTLTVTATGKFNNQNLSITASIALSVEAVEKKE